MKTSTKHSGLAVGP